MTEMVVINGVRYKPADAKKVGGRPAPDEHTGKKPVKRRPANKARKPPEPVTTENTEE
ncbi:hypothetical protein AB0X98_01110 [Rothia koreensis]|uniref:hypothetical protein n=1 Tax=Rothia koreensis TaxID=592378 RepID=UPI003F247B19